MFPIAIDVCQRYLHSRGWSYGVVSTAEYWQVDAHRGQQHTISRAPSHVEAFNLAVDQVTAADGQWIIDLT